MRSPRCRAWAGAMVLPMVVAAMAGIGHAGQEAETPAVTSEFCFEEAAFRSCHASTPAPVVMARRAAMSSQRL